MIFDFLIGSCWIPGNFCVFFPDGIVVDLIVGFPFVIRLESMMRVCGNY